MFQEFLSFFGWGPIYLDSDGDSDVGLVEVSLIETSQVPVMGRVAQTEEISTAVQGAGPTQEVTTENSKNKLYEGIPKNKLSREDAIKSNGLHRDLELQQMLAKHESTNLIREEREAAVNKEILEYPTTIHSNIAKLRPATEREMFEITKELEVIRLKESPTDIGQPLKKRKFED